MDDLNSIQNKIQIELADAAFFYLSNDPERALGLEKIIPNFHAAYIDKSPFGEYFIDNNIKAFCLSDFTKEFLFRSSYKLITHSEFLKYFSHEKMPHNFIQTFKISPAFEKCVRLMGAGNVNTSSALNRLFENKITQFHELRDLPVHLPKTQIIQIEDVNFENASRDFGLPFVIQFARGHTGSGTVFIDNGLVLENLQKNFPRRTVKLSSMIKGDSYTLNACVGTTKTYAGGLSYQITGVEGLTPEPGGTIGNDWAYRKKVSNKVLEEVIASAVTVGDRMRQAGYLGLFGLDIIIDDDEQRPYIIEINARQPASIPMFTKIQLKKGQIPLSIIHICEFLNLDYEIDSVLYNMEACAPMDYAQVFIRADRDILVNNQVQTGIYRLQGDNVAIDWDTKKVKPGTVFLDEDKDKALIFHKKGFTIEDMGNGGLLILAQSMGRNIRYNQELARIQCSRSVIMSSGMLAQWMNEALSAIKNYQL